MPIGSLINSGATIYAQHMANQANQQLAQQQADWNWQMQQDQQKYDWDMWNHMNQYNSPAAQMQRFKEAGLNPHLIYGKGTPGNATPLKSPDIRPYQRADVQSIMRGVDVFGDHMRMTNLQAQTDNVKTQAEVNEANANLLNAKAITEGFEGTIRMAKAGIAPQLAEQSLAAATQNNELLGAKIRSELVNADFQEQTKDKRIQILEQQFANEKWTGDLREQQKKINEYKIKLQSAGIKESDPVLLRWMALGLNSPEGHKILQELKQNTIMGFPNPWQGWK